MNGDLEFVGKRALDLAGAVVMLVLLTPLMALIAIAVRVGSPGPIFFRQERSGRFGRVFSIYKFRTMTVSASSIQLREASAGDPRITPIGGLLRRMGLDELPQLINVLRGEMSLVGPRPLLAWENALCDARQAERLRVRPGLTGLSQVNGRNAIPWEQRVEWDLCYIQEQSVLLDLQILARTIPTSLLGRNAYAANPSPVLHRAIGMKRWRISGASLRTFEPIRSQRWG